MSELHSDRRENHGADRRIESGSVDTPRARARSVMTTKLYGGRPSSAISNRVTSARKKKEDVLVLSHQSLMTFASFVNQQLIEQITVKLGVHRSTINKVKTNVIDEVSKLNEPIVLQNFKMLWSWRGPKSTSRMVEQLLNVLRGINRWELAAVVSTAHKEQRRMRMTDFM